MSKYTTQLRWIVEQTGQALPVPDGQEYADAVYKAIGLDKYPIFDETYRSSLNDKIIDHFYFREIGFETAAQFRWYMRRTMNEIMPYYNQLYSSKDLITDPLNDRDLSWTESHTLERDTDSAGTSENSGTSESDSSGTSHNRNVYQDTPMSLLQNGADRPNIESLDYATNVTYDDGSTSDSTDSSFDNSGRTTSTVDMDESGNRIHTEKGRLLNQSDLLLKYRKTFINIDMEVIQDLEDLFLSLW